MYTAAALLQGSKVHYKAKNKNGAETAPFHIKRNIKELTIRRMSKFNVSGAEPAGPPYSRSGAAGRRTAAAEAAFGKQ